MGQRNRSRFPSRSEASRRKVSWGIGPSGQIVAISTSSVNLFPSGAEAQLSDMTITRFRGSLLLTMNNDEVANEGFDWAFGVAVVSQNAFGVGITAIPAPLTDIAWDGWFVHEQGTIVQPEAVPNFSSDALVERRPLDSKAMRKINETDTIVAVLETSEIGDGTTMSAFLRTRMLFKLA